MIRSGLRRLARSFNLCCRYTDDLIVFNKKKLSDYFIEIYPSELTVEKANKSNHLPSYLDLSFMIDSGGKLSTSFNVMTLTSTLSIFHSFQATHHLALLMMYKFRSSWDMHDAAHIMMISPQVPSTVYRPLLQGYIALWLEKPFKKLYGRYQDLIAKY